MPYTLPVVPAGAAATGHGEDWLVVPGCKRAAKRGASLAPEWGKHTRLEADGDLEAALAAARQRAAQWPPGAPAVEQVHAALCTRGWFELQAGLPLDWCARRPPCWSAAWLADPR
jgi:hypothetical protein